MPRARGFTLIEIMVVVIIIGLLAAVIVPQIMSRVDEARVTKAKSDIQRERVAIVSDGDVFRWSAFHHFRE